MLSVASATNSEDALVFSFVLRNPATAQASPGISVSGSILSEGAGGLTSPFTSVAMVEASGALLGVADAAEPLLTLVPTVALASMGQSSPFAGAENTLTLTLQFAQDMAVGSTLTIAGLTGTNTPDTSALAVNPAP